MTAVTTAPPPIPSTGDEEADEELALLRTTTNAIHTRQEEVDALSKERQTLVLSLRRRGVLFRTIADAVPTTEQTIYKIHREARREEAHGRNDHAFCSAANCPVVAAREAAEAPAAAETTEEAQ